MRDPGVAGTSSRGRLKEPKGRPREVWFLPPWAMAGRVGRHPVLRAYITPLTAASHGDDANQTDGHGKMQAWAPNVTARSSSGNSQIAHRTHLLSSSDEEGGGGRSILTLTTALLDHLSARCSYRRLALSASSRTCAAIRS